MNEISTTERINDFRADASFQQIERLYLSISVLNGRREHVEVAQATLGPLLSTPQCLYWGQVRRVTCTHCSVNWKKISLVHTYSVNVKDTVFYLLFNVNAVLVITCLCEYIYHVLLVILLCSK